MSYFYDLSKTPRKILNQAIVKNIVAESNGALLDPSDLSTLYQDAAGTTPVTAVEQPVGKIIDKSGNGNHATQSITASRPVLSARKNILLATETQATQSVTTLATQYTLSFTGTGSVTLSGAATGTLTGNGTDRVSLTFTPTTGTLTLTVSGSVTKAQLELGAVAGPYQRVNTGTDYDTDERYFPKYLRFDGVDDYLNLPYMGLYANGSASVVMAIARSKTGTIKYALTEGHPAGGKNYIPLRLLDTGISSRIINDAGTTVILTPVGAGVPTSLPEVITFIDDSANLKLLKNSQTSNNSSYARSGTLTLNNLTIGAISQTAVTENMLANLYSLIITKSALTDAQRIKCERYAASKAGVIL